MDRQDIDALLIGALYGELTPADEARLAAHLESHPTDRGALDDLKNTRAAVRESQFLAFQLEPPQAVSALLLQEAHRRAPKRVVAKDAKDSDEKESWFYRFTRYFMAHPAMAAAAMLVLVVGVAGTMYMRKGNQSAYDQVGQEQLALDKNTVETPAGATTATPPPADPAAADQAGEAGDDRYRADVDSTKLEAQQQELAKQSDRAAETRAPAEKKKAILLERADRQPKDLDEKPRAKLATKSGAKNDSASDDFARAPADSVLLSEGSRGTADGRIGGGGGGATGAGAPARNAPVAAPAPATTSPTTGTATTAKPAKPSVTKEAEKAESAPAQDPTLLAWAKSEHNRALTLAKNGDCRAAAKIAVSVQNRAPEYYAQTMGTDRGLKNCQSYIANERDAEAERSGKARSQKRVNADEAAPAQVK